MTLPEITEARDRLLELKSLQAEARDEELRIREYIANKLHTGVEGSKTITVDGIKVTVTRNLSRTIDSVEAEKLSKEYPEISLACLRWKAELRTGEYKKNTEILDDYITTRSAPSTVAFK